MIYNEIIQIKLPLIVEKNKLINCGKIHMVDLKGQYKKIKDQIDTALIQTIESTDFINGPIVKSFLSHWRIILELNM